ncbi:hypothetical protein BJX63DRAFT_385377 [Aspergillus granulosus]|uniref:Uncharacterized protein n=1 Tax=Aspergillus granulosus TaxID=176169 RepID=A0ABR4HPY7_9EURO
MLASVLAELSATTSAGSRVPDQPGPWSVDSVQHTPTRPRALELVRSRDDDWSCPSSVYLKEMRFPENNGCLEPSDASFRSARLVLALGSRGQPRRTETSQSTTQT